MKRVQQALAAIGIPVMAGVWRSDSITQTSPEQYVVYSTTMSEYAHEDDAASCRRTFVYMNLWSNTDPTDMADTRPSRRRATIPSARSLRGALRWATTAC